MFIELLELLKTLTEETGLQDMLVTVMLGLSFATLEHLDEQVMTMPING
jgi:hypothetical protein